MRLLAEEGIGADVSTLGELRFAQKAGIPGDRLVVHGNNKSDDELRAAAAKLAALVVVDSLEEIERARAAGVTRTLIRFTPGIEANTHEAIRTAHHGSKFGLPANDVIEALKQAQDTEGLHVHIGSQLLDLDAALQAVDWLATFAARARSETGWSPRTSISVAASAPDLAGRDPPPPSRSSSAFSAGSAVITFAGAGNSRARPLARRTRRRDALLGRLGQALARRRAYVAVDGGISDNPRPQLYGARYTAVIANRTGEPGRRLRRRRQALRIGRRAHRPVDLPRP